MKEIVIELSDTEYNQLIYGDDGLDYEILEQSVVNGTVLPKHGRLIDIDNIQEIELEDSLTVLTHTKGDEVDWHIDAPTILEANKT